MTLDLERMEALKLSREVTSGLIRRDPLATYQHATWASEWICDHLADGWTYWHAANSGAKSHSMAALDVALAQGRPTLGLEGDGFFWDGRPWHSKATPLPVIPRPVDIGIGTPSYKLGAAGSIISKIRECLGAWPNHEERTAGSVSVFHVKNRLDTSDDWHSWSHIYIFPYEGPFPEGVRLDKWSGDEPPPELWLSAILNRGKRGRPLYGGIGATPVVPRLWRPVRAQFPDAHCVFVKKRARVQSSVYDNRFLTASDIERQEAANPPSHPLSKAKLLGEHVNAVGSCPFDLIALGKMLAECTEPEREAFNVPMEGEGGKPHATIEVTVEWFKKPAPNLVGYLSLDPASGVDSASHNPLGFLLSEQRSGDLLARWNGRIAPFSAGVLAATIARQFDAWIDVEMNDHWGVNVVRGVQAAGYAGRLCHENRLLAPNTWGKEVGFKANAETVNQGIGAIQEWITAYSAGIRYAKCPSRSVIESLMDAELDERDRVISPQMAGGAHGEDRVLWGRNLSKCVKRASIQMPTLVKPERTAVEVADAALVAKIMGRSKKPIPPGGGRLLTANPPSW